MKAQNVVAKFHPGLQSPQELACAQSVADLICMATTRIRPGIGPENFAWLQDVVRELAFHAPLCAHLSTAESLRHARSPGFRIRECHMEVRSALTQLESLATGPLATCLRSITLSDWSVVHTGILLWIQTAVDEGKPYAPLAC